jgi:hypothetical protein
MVLNLVKLFAADKNEDKKNGGGKNFFLFNVFLTRKNFFFKLFLLVSSGICLKFTAKNEKS